MSEVVLCERRGAIAILTMNLASKRNALSTTLSDALETQLSELQRDHSCRVIILTGGAHFCAGGELGSFSDNAMELRNEMRAGHRVVRQIITGRVPVIAAVEGSAFGAGLSLAAACDFVIADSDARFGAVYGKVGLMPDWGALWTLPQRVGMRRTRQIVMFSEVLGGEQALRDGLADHLAEQGAVLKVALNWAERLASAAPGAISATKAFMARSPMALEASLDWEADMQALLLASEDFAEGTQSFFDKRTAVFNGR